MPQPQLHAQLQTQNHPQPQLQHAKPLACVKAALDKKAENIKILDLSKISGFTDYFVICSAMSDRQVKAIADGVERSMRKAGYRAITNEGHSDGRWVLIDFGDTVIHIFLDALRDYYDLESLWAEAPRIQIPADFFGPGASHYAAGGRTSEC